MEKASDIKKKIIERKLEQSKPVETAQILGVKGFLFRVSNYEMEGWRDLVNDKDPARSRLNPAKMIQICFRAEDGTPIFEELDLPLIAGIEDAQIYPVFKRCLAINGLGSEATEIILKNCVMILGADGVYAVLTSMGYPCPNCSSASASTSSANCGSPNSSGPRDKPPKAGEPS